MRFFVAGGGCYGSYYLRQLDRARSRGKLKVTEICIVDRNPHCAVAEHLSSVPGARLQVADWCDFGAEVKRNREQWKNDMWVPTPIGPHILSEWVRRDLAARFQTRSCAYEGKLPEIDYAQLTAQGQPVLSHAPGICPTNCVEPTICPLTRERRDWEMAETVRKMVVQNTQIAQVGVFVCQHYAHGVGTIPLAQVFTEWDRLEQAVGTRGARIAVATVSSCHGLVDVIDVVPR